MNPLAKNACKRYQRNFLAAISSAELVPSLAESVREEGFALLARSSACELCESVWVQVQTDLIVEQLEKTHFTGLWAAAITRVVMAFS